MQGRWLDFDQQWHYHVQKGTKRWIEEWLAQVLCATTEATGILVNDSKTMNVLSASRARFA